MFRMQRSRIPRPTRAERRELAAEHMAEFDRTSERAVLTHLRHLRQMPDPEWASQQPSCPQRQCPAQRLTVLLDEARLAVTRCVHGQCTETAVRPIGASFACEIHKSRPEGI